MTKKKEKNKAVLAFYSVAVISVMLALIILMAANSESRVSGPNFFSAIPLVVVLYMNTRSYILVGHNDQWLEVSSLWGTTKKIPISKISSFATKQKLHFVHDVALRIYFHCSLKPRLIYTDNKDELVSALLEAGIKDRSFVL